MTTVVTNDRCWVYYGLADELEHLGDKITLYNGIEFIAIDTDERYLYDAENKEWLVCTASA